MSIPDAINAGRKAFEPLITVTIMSSSMQCFIKIEPGSDMPGYPASEVNAIFFPSFNKEMIF